MLPEEVWIDGKCIKPPEYLKGLYNDEAYTYDYLIYRACYRITACLEKWLGVPLDYDGRYIPALIMLNPFQGPIWMHPEQGHEVGAIREAVKATRRAKQSLKEAAALEASGNLAEAQNELERALGQVNDLPPPVSIWMRESSAQSIREYQGLIDHIHSLFSEYLEERKGLRGHQRARTFAIVLRAIFEVHSDIPITVGVTEGVPDGVYAKCLQELFSRAGVTVNFYRYAREAKALAYDDSQLAKFRDFLRDPPAFEGQREI